MTCCVTSARLCPFLCPFSVSISPAKGLQLQSMNPKKQRSDLYLTWCVVFKTKIIKSSLLPKASLPIWSGEGGPHLLGPAPRYLGSGWHKEDSGGRAAPSATSWGPPGALDAEGRTDLKRRSWVGFPGWGSLGGDVGLRRWPCLRPCRQRK